VVLVQKIKRRGEAIAVRRGELGRLADGRHLLGGPVGPPARWAATTNVEGRSGTDEGPRGP